MTESKWLSLRALPPSLRPRRCGVCHPLWLLRHCEICLKMLNRYKLSLQIEAIYYETPIQFAKGFTFVRTLHCEVCRHFFPSLPALLNDSLALISCYLQAEAIYFRNAEKIHKMFRSCTQMSSRGRNHPSPECRLRDDADTEVGSPYSITISEL